MYERDGSGFNGDAAVAVVEGIMSASLGVLGYIGANVTEDVVGALMELLLEDVIALA